MAAVPLIRGENKGYFGVNPYIYAFGPSGQVLFAEQYSKPGIVLGLFWNKY
ncbi:MAG TPA: hypothetical protein VNE41_05725 [Chitinophagaceae bacterium]|nr:hypothetical protein [Chitinophagaceae bacterium]